MKLRLLIVVGPLLGTLGCWVPKETGDTMQRDIRTLQEQQAASQKALAEQQARLEEQLQAKINELQKVLDDLNRASRSTGTDLGVQIERLTKEVQELRGMAELADFRLGKLEGKIEGEGSLTARLDALDKGGASSGAGVTGGTGTPAGGREPPKGKKELLAYAAGLAKDGKTADARGVYRDIIKQWPSEAGVTDEAYFRIGETYFGEKKCRSALPEYAKVVEKFPTGSFADDAYFKIGLCSVETGNLEDAKIFFGEIVRNYKKSPLLKEAQKRLDEVQAKLDQEAKAKGKGKGKGK